jgi:hypothetical protein
MVFIGGLQLGVVDAAGEDREKDDGENDEPVCAGHGVLVGDGADGSPGGGDGLLCAKNPNRPAIAVFSVITSPSPPWNPFHNSHAPVRPAIAASRVMQKMIRRV